MKLSNVRLIATDMDGTLLNSAHELNPRIFSLFEMFRERGILFGAASGRQLYNLEDCFHPIKDEMLFLAENGSFVRYKGKELLVQALEPEAVKRFIRIAREIPGTYIIFCGKTKAWVENDAPEFMEEMCRYFARYEVVENLLEVSDDCLKVTICDLTPEGAPRSYGFLSEFIEDYQIKVSGKIWVDISHKLANKGRALQVVQDHFNISPEETMVFGDYFNDLEMMRQARFSFAMENAMDEVKAAANYQAKSNDENGVIEILEKVVES